MLGGWRSDGRTAAGTANYLVCVHRAVDNEAADEWEWEVYAVPLREPLPTIPIPCRATDPDVALALQPLIDRMYVESGHDDIDYSRPPPPPGPAPGRSGAGLGAGDWGAAA